MNKPIRCLHPAPRRHCFQPEFVGVLGRGGTLAHGEWRLWSTTRRRPAVAFSRGEPAAANLLTTPCTPLDFVVMLGPSDALARGESHLGSTTGRQPAVAFSRGEPIAAPTNLWMTPAPCLTLVAPWPATSCTSAPRPASSQRLPSAPMTGLDPR